MDANVFCAHTEMVDITAVIPNPRNPNKHPEAQITLLAKVIKHQGWRNPIVVSRRSGFVVKGHGRLAAAKLLGLETVPVDYQEYPNEAAEWADMVADNKIAELAEQDNEVLKELINELDGQIDLDLTGFSAADLSGLFSEGDDAPAPGTGDEPELGDTEGIQAESQYGVIVMCENEAEQEAAYNALVEQGYKCKVVAV